MKVVLICGSRDWTDRTPIENWLIGHTSEGDVLVVGGAKGADTIAKDIGERRGLVVAECKAPWAYYGRSAGPIRNRAMIALRPEIVVAFKCGNTSIGTDNMLNYATLNGVPTEVYIDGKGWQ